MSQVKFTKSAIEAMTRRGYQAYRSSEALRPIRDSLVLPEYDKLPEPLKKAYMSFATAVVSMALGISISDEV